MINLMAGIVNNTIQTALVLQGGGALAATEGRSILCSVYFDKKRILYKQINKNVFDIIAGTSGGAINAAIIVVLCTHRRKKGFNIKDSGKVQ